MQGLGARSGTQPSGAYGHREVGVRSAAGIPRRGESPNEKPLRSRTPIF